MPLPDDPIERMLVAWAAAQLTRDSDRIIGTDRKEEWLNCISHAAAASKLLQPHPLDRYMATERRKWADCVRPRYDVWEGPACYRVADATQHQAVIRGLHYVRLGFPPNYAAERAAREADFVGEFQQHRREAVEQKIYHYCRCAGLLPETD